MVMQDTVPWLVQYTAYLAEKLKYLVSDHRSDIHAYTVYLCKTKVLVELAALQDVEVGDGTTSVVIIAAELLKNADELVKQKIHPTSIIAGYRFAMKESIKYIKEHLTYKGSIFIIFIPS